MSEGDAMASDDEQEAKDGSPAEVVRTLWDLNMGGAHRDRGPAKGDVGPTPEVIRIKFQDGPVREVGVNGCQIEDVLDVLAERLEGFQRGALACRENSDAQHFLHRAHAALERRTASRTAQGVEGTNQAHKSEAP